MSLKTQNIKEALFIPMAFALCSIVFFAFPQIDIFTSSLFYSHGFYLKGSLFEVFFYKSVPIVIALSALLSITIYIFNKMMKKTFLGITSRILIYIILVLALAPGLIVNTTLKEHWGRPRPNQIKEFDGNKEFTPAFVRSNQGGNSFSSGHGAAAFSLFGLALLARRGKKFFVSLALLYGVLVSIARIIAGGHFLSDSVTSFFIVYITSYLLYNFIIKRKI